MIRANDPVDPMEHGESRLPYPTRPMKVRAGVVEEYIIPDEDRAAVLEQLYPFAGVPDLDDVMYDIHEGRTFVVREFRVFRDDGMNWLVSPYFPHSGGSVIDWVRPNLGDEDDEPDWEEEEEEFDGWGGDEEA